MFGDELLIAGLDELAQVPAVCVLHLNEKLGVVLKGIKVGDNVWVPQQRQGLALCDSLARAIGFEQGR